MNRLTVIDNDMSRTKKTDRPESQDPFVVGINHLIHTKGQNQKWLAGKIETSENTISQVMLGRNRYLPTLEKMAAVFKKTYDDVRKLGASIIAGEFEKGIQGGSVHTPEKGKPPGEYNGMRLFADMEILKHELAEIRRQMAGIEMLIKQLIQDHPRIAGHPSKIQAR